MSAFKVPILKVGDVLIVSFQSVIYYGMVLDLDVGVLVKVDL